MKQTFPGYYRPTDEEFSQLWDDCIFTLDTNVLLHLYRYTPDTREDLLSILAHLADHDRLWISHQAAFEYQKNRLKTIADQKNKYKAICNNLEGYQSKIEKEFEQLRHPFIDDEFVDFANKLFTETFEKIYSQLDLLEQQHPDLLTDDVIRDSLTELLDGKVGKPFSATQLEQIYKQGQKRYGNFVPPGYKDQPKDGNIYGDLVIWMQIIAFAQEAQKPIVFVTDDDKEDWWLKFQGETIGPRPELIQEMAQEAGAQFYMYKADQFMEHARERFDLNITPESIDEVRVIGEQETTQPETEYSSGWYLPELYTTPDPFLSATAHQLNEQISGVAQPFLKQINEQLTGLTRPTQELMQQLNVTAGEELRRQLMADMKVLRQYATGVANSTGVIMARLSGTSKSENTINPTTLISGFNPGDPDSN